MTIKREDLEKQITDAYLRGLADGKSQSNGVAAGTVLAMLFGLPCKILHDHYGFGFRKKLPEFGDLLIEAYQKFDESEQSVKELQEYIYEATGIKFE